MTTAEWVRFGVVFVVAYAILTLLAFGLGRRQRGQEESAALTVLRAELRARQIELARLSDMARERGDEARRWRRAYAEVRAESAKLRAEHLAFVRQITDRLYVSPEGKVLAEDPEDGVEPMTVDEADQAAMRAEEAARHRELERQRSVVIVHDDDAMPDEGELRVRFHNDGGGNDDDDAA